MIIVSYNLALNNLWSWNSVINQRPSINPSVCSQLFRLLRN